MVAANSTPRPMLAQGRVRHVGDPVALVVAETLDQAKDAAEALKLTAEDLKQLGVIDEIVAEPLGGA